MAGVALVCAAALLLAALAAGGDIVVRRAQARSAADLAAIGAAQALWYGETEAPCALAERIAGENGGTLESCVVDGRDVQVRASVRTQVPLVPHVAARARAGPRPCGAASGSAGAGAQHAGVYHGFSRASPCAHVVTGDGACILSSSTTRVIARRNQGITWH